MATLIHVFLGLHILGIGALLGGFLFQLKALRTGEARVVPGMLYGALTMLVTGFAMVGVKEADGMMVDNLKIGIKLAFLIVILALVYVKRDEERLPAPLFGTIGALTVANIFIAVLWM